MSRIVLPILFVLVSVAVNAQRFSIALGVYSGVTATYTADKGIEKDPRYEERFEAKFASNPAYIQKYFGVSATGQPIASNALRLKAEATQKDKAYTHPMFRVGNEMQAQIDAFVNDAIAKYAAGTCGR